MRWIVCGLWGLWSAADAQWVQLADFPGTARDDAAAFSLGGEVFLGTGRDIDFAYTNDWFAFSEETESWTPVADLPASGRQYCTSFTDGNFGYLFGGIDDNGPLNELWRYDPNLDQWEQRASLPGPGRYACASILPGHIVGGLLAGGVTTNEHWYYDTASDSWSALPDLPGPGRHRAAASRGWIVGGADQDYTALADGYQYLSWLPEPWIPLGEELPGPRYGSDAAGGVLVGGASSDTDLHADAWVEYLSSWTAFSIPPFPGGVRRGGAMAESSYIADISWVYYGTGTNLIQRHMDWWRLAFSISNVDERDNSKLVVWPVPASDIIHVGPATLNGKELYEIRDISGRSILPPSLLGAGSIDVRNLTAGQYHLLVWQGTQRSQTTFMIIR